MSAARRLLALLLAGLAAIPRGAAAQDFASPAMGGPSPSAFVLLEHGLCGPAAGGSPVVPGGSGSVGRLGLEAAATRWFGIPELTTRAAAVVVGRRSLRVAGGVAQTGDPELGWSALGIAAGVAREAGGAALRAVARRDRDRDAITSPLGPGVGLEAGAGAWVEVGATLRVWAAAPQLWTRGLAPPLARSLEIGGVFAGRGLRAWWARRAAVRSSGAPGAHSAGLGIATGPWSVWLEASDRPLRGGIGLSARAGPLSAAFGVDDHPVLGETVRCSIGIEAGR